MLLAFLFQTLYLENIRNCPQVDRAAVWPHGPSSLREEAPSSFCPPTPSTTDQF